MRGRSRGSSAYRTSMASSVVDQSLPTWSISDRRRQLSSQIGRSKAHHRGQETPLRFPDGARASRDRSVRRSGITQSPGTVAGPLARQRVQQTRSCEHGLESSRTHAWRHSSTQVDNVSFRQSKPGGVSRATGVPPAAVRCRTRRAASCIRFHFGVIGRGPEHTADGIPVAGHGRVPDTLVLRTQARASSRHMAGKKQNNGASWAGSYP
jgi:hypothetical protein